MLGYGNPVLYFLVTDFIVACLHVWSSYFGVCISFLSLCHIYMQSVTFAVSFTAQCLAICHPFIWLHFSI